MKPIEPDKLAALAALTPAARRVACRENFSYFFAYYFAPYVKYAFAPFHYDFFDDCHDLADGTLKEAVWMGFRESAKTSVAKALLVHACAYSWAKYVNADSQDKANAERFLFDCAVEMRSNPRLAQDFGVLYPAERDPSEMTQKQLANFVTATGVRVEAHSTQESVRGRVHGSHRPDLLFLDDFETAKSVRSTAATQSIKAHIQEFYGGLDSTARVVYLCNYISEFGVVQWLLDRAKENPGIRVRNVPAIVGGMDIEDAVASGTPPTWPAKYALTDAEAERLGKVSLESKRRQMKTPDRGDADWLAEMLNRPVDLKNAEFRREWFKRIPMEEVQRKVCTRWLAVDTAVSKENSSDETGLTLCWADEPGNWYLKSWGVRVPPERVVDLLFELWVAYKLDGIGVEDTVFLSAIKPYLDAEMARRGVFLRITPLKHAGRGKDERIRGLIPRYSSGSVWHIDGECHGLEDQLLRFPNLAHDDVADSAAYLPDLVKKPVNLPPPPPPPEPRYSRIGL